MKTNWILCVVFVMSVAASVCAEPVSFPICTNTADQGNPAVSGNVVVWGDIRNGNWDIYGKNTSTSQEFPVCTNNSLHYNPAISGQNVVWKDNRSSTNWDIYRFNISNGGESFLARVDAVGQPCTYDVSENIVVFQRFYDIYTYNISTGQEGFVYQTTLNGADLHISGDNIVWRKGRNNCGYNLATSSYFTFANGPVIGSSIDIDGNMVVWEQYPEGDDNNPDIWGMNLLTGQEFPICLNSAEQREVAISGDIVVWKDKRNGNFDIYGYDLLTGTEFPISIDLRTQCNPDISGNLVVWQDLRSGNYDTYGAVVPEPSTIVLLISGLSALLLRRRK